MAHPRPRYDSGLIPGGDAGHGGDRGAVQACHGEFYCLPRLLDVVGSRLHTHLHRTHPPLLGVHETRCPAFFMAPRDPGTNKQSPCGGYSPVLRSECPEERSADCSLDVYGGVDTGLWGFRHRGSREHGRLHSEICNAHHWSRCISLAVRLRAAQRATASRQRRSGEWWRR